MANDNNEDVKYSFEGDTSSLKKAAQEAINILDQLDAKVKSAFKGADTSKAETSVRNTSVRLSDLTSTSQKVVQAVETMKQSFSDLMSVFDPLTRKFASMKETSSNALGGISQKVSEVSEAFRRAGSGDDDAGSGKLQKFAAVLGTAIPASGLKAAATVATVTTRIKDFIQGLTTSKGKIDENASSAYNAGAKFNDFGGHIKNAHEKITKLVSALNPVPSIINQLSGAIKTLVGVQFGDWLAQCVDQAIRFTETLNEFNTVMDTSVDNANEFVTKMQEFYGLDPNTIMRTTSQFYQLASAVETPAKSAEKMAVGLTSLTTDLASLFDVDFNTVANNVTSGMQGMTRAVRKYGIDIRMATLNQTAANLGLKINAATTSEANRQALRYITMVQQARVAVGDFGKTIESPANQLRILKEQFTQCARAIGNLFLPVLARILPYINGVIMALRAVITLIGNLLGIQAQTFGGMTDAAAGVADTMGDASGAVDNLGDSAAKAAKKAKQLLAPFDELNILQEDTSAADNAGTGIAGGAGGDYLDPALLSTIDQLNLKLEDTKMKANRVRDAILEFLGIKYDMGEISITPGGFTDQIVKAIEESDWTKVGTVLGDMLNSAVELSQEKIDWKSITTKFTTLAANVAKVINGFVAEVDWSNLGKVVGAGFQLVVDTGLAFFETLDVKKIGKAFGDFVTGGIQSINWTKVARLISDIVLSVPKLINGAMEGIDWASVGKALVDFLIGIKWGELLGELAELIINVLVAGLVTALSAVAEAIKQIGSMIITGLQGGITDALASIGSWIVKHIFTPIIDGVKNAFGIHSPSTVFAEIGGQLIAGLKNGITTALSAIGTWISTNIFAPVMNGLKTAFGIVSGVASKIKEIGKAVISGLKNGITSALNAIGSWIKNNITDPFKNGVIENFGIVKGIASVFVTIGGNLIAGLKKGITSALTGIDNWVKSNITDPITNAVHHNFDEHSPSVVFETIGENLMYGLQNGMSNEENSTVDTAVDASDNTASAFDITDSVTEYGSQAMQGFADGMSSQFYSVISLVQNEFISPLQSLFAGLVASAQAAASQVIAAARAAAEAAAQVASDASAHKTTVTKKPSKTMAAAIPKKKLATGGVVTSPTFAQIGEGGRNEAVIPLGDSPQVNELLQKFAEVIDGSDGGDGTTVVVPVYLDGEVIYQNQQKVSRKRGVKFGMGVFER